MSFNTFGLVFSVCLFISLLASLKIGHVFARRQHPRKKESSGGTSLDGLVFALLGLLLAFTFSGALVSYDTNRVLLTKEASDIGGMYSQVDLFPEEKQDVMRLLLRKYAETRLEATQATMYSLAEQDALERAQKLQNEIWKHIVQSTHNTLESSTVIGHRLDAFNAMASAPGEQLADQRNHIPMIIYALMFILAVMAALLAGYGMAGSSTLPIMQIAIFSAAIAVTMYTIIDLEYARTGLFNAVSNNFMLAEMIETMK